MMRPTDCTGAPLDYSTLDPGIREVVRFLHARGYETLDSGDGRSKLSAGDVEGVTPWPHVVIRSSPETLTLDADRLFAQLTAHGVQWRPMGPDDDGVGIQASYDPADGHAIIFLSGVTNDDVLERA